MLKNHRNLTIFIIGALCVAMSFGLSYIKLFHMPMGGSVTLGSMLPLMLFSYLFGPWWGILAGAVYGMLQFIQNPEVVHWAQMLLDYPVAFAALGLAGFMKKTHLSLAAIVGGAGRFVCHLLTGAIFFSEYAGDRNAWLYSFLYNGGYLGVDILICVILAVFIPVKKIRSQIEL